MGSNSYLPILGQGSAIISLNCQCIVVQNALHVMGLVVPLYSLRAHFTQHICGLTGALGVGIVVWFPTFVLLVYTSKDCHLTYKSLGQSASLELLHYVQPQCSPSLYPSEPPSTSVAKQTRMDPVVIEDDSSNKLVWCYPQPKCTTPWLPPTSMADSLSHAPPPVDLSTVLDQLQLLAKAISSLKSQGNSPPSHLSCKLSQPAPNDSQLSPILASTMSWDEVMSLLNCAGSSLPPIRPCNMANASDTKTHWSVKKLHQVMGCQKNCNYKHLLQVSRDGE